MVTRTFKNATVVFSRRDDHSFEIAVTGDEQYELSTKIWEAIMKVAEEEENEQKSE